MEDVKQDFTERLCGYVCANLSGRGIEGIYAETRARACERIAEMIPEGALVGLGGSVTLEESVWSKGCARCRSGCSTGIARAFRRKRSPRCACRGWRATFPGRGERGHDGRHPSERGRLREPRRVDDLRAEEGDPHRGREQDRALGRRRARADQAGVRADEQPAVCGGHAVRAHGNLRRRGLPAAGAHLQPDRHHREQRHRRADDGRPCPARKWDSEIYSNVEC